MSGERVVASPLDRRAPERGGVDQYYISTVVDWANSSSSLNVDNGGTGHNMMGEVCASL